MLCRIYNRQRMHDCAFIDSSGNRTPGSYCNSLVAQAKYYSSFQLTHMYHAQLIESTMAAKGKTSSVLTTLPAR